MAYLLGVSTSREGQLLDGILHLPVLPPVVVGYSLGAGSSGAAGTMAARAVDGLPPGKRPWRVASWRFRYWSGPRLSLEAVDRAEDAARTLGASGSLHHRHLPLTLPGILTGVLAFAQSLSGSARRSPSPPIFRARRTAAGTLQSCPDTGPGSRSRALRDLGRRGADRAGGRSGWHVAHANAGGTPCLRPASRNGSAISRSMRR